MCLFHADNLPQRITPQYKEVELGKSVTFECLAEHILQKILQLGINWIFNFGRVEGYATMDMPRGYKLHITSVNTIHSGNYTCVGFYFNKKRIGQITLFIATAVLKVFGMHYLTNFSFFYEE